MSQIYLLYCFSQVLHILFPLSISHTLPPSLSISLFLSLSIFICGLFFFISLGTVLYFLFSTFLSLSLFSLFPFSLSHSPFLYTTIPHISLTLIDLILSPLLHLILFLHSLTPPLYTTHNLFHPSHPLLLLESYRTRFNRAEGASDDPELAALALLLESNCKIGGGGSKLPTHPASVRGGLR